MSADVASLSDTELRQAATEFARALETGKLTPQRRDTLLEAFRAVEAEMRKRNLIRK